MLTTFNEPSGSILRVKKASWAKAAALAEPIGVSKIPVPQFGTCISGCNQYYIEDDSDAFCVDSRTPPTICERKQARIGDGRPCKKYKVIAYTCGAGQPCSDDAIDNQASISCGTCRDDDGDGVTTCDGDCDDSNTPEGFNTRPGADERCGNSRDDNCDGRTDEQPCCDNSDADGDGVSVCDGDCNDGNANLIFDCGGGGDSCPSQTVYYCWEELPPPHCPYEVIWTQTCGTPLLVDTSGDGFDLTSPGGGVRFDLNGDGVKESLAWTAAGSDDAWLALDRDGDGRVTSGRELFGNFTPQPDPPPGVPKNGFLALAEYDRAGLGGNSDGAIDSRDPVFPRLRLWLDSNHDGVSEPRELHALPSLGVASVGLDYREAMRRDRHGQNLSPRP